MRSLNFDSPKPLLYLVATPIGNLQEVSPRTIEVLSSVDLVACEDTRVTGKLLSLLGIKKELVSLREHNEVSVSKEIAEKMKNGLIKRLHIVPHNCGLNNRLQVCTNSDCTPWR